MAKDQGLTPALPRGRPAAPSAEPRKRRVGPIEFAREVRAEARKVTWTSRRETWIMSVMVFIMILITAFFFVAIDFGLRIVMQFIFKLGT
ncbi:MAG TPA: preprotein translocase subunit SecE [Caulobacteraceae bacterium]|jgi:preprotein translocase subunit SecE|nr:preprotein translocase subunit SecE [Caulobacteraceae bacterium]